MKPNERKKAIMAGKQQRKWRYLPRLIDEGVVR